MSVGPSPSVMPVLNRLDWALGEAGRREHRFGWLRDDAGDWIALAAYYPRSRVVVIADPDPRSVDRARAEVPAHGLFLVVLEPGELERDAAALATDLRRRLLAAGWRSGPDTVEAVLDARPAPVGPPTLAIAEPPWPAPAPVLEPQHDHDHDPSIEYTFGPMPSPLAPPRPGRTGPPTRPVGDPAAGITLVIAVALELVLGGAVLGLGAGDPILGFGFVLDACARVLGTVAASQAGDADAAWSAVLFGSPGLWGLTPAPGQDIARAAQFTAAVAGAVLALGFVVAIL